MSDTSEEIRLQGVPLSEGIEIGIPFFVTESNEVVPEFPISLGEVDGEIERYRLALQFSREDLRQLQSDLMNAGSEEAVTIIDAHIQMLEDPLMTTDMEDKIRQTLRNTESVFDTAIRDYGHRISQVRSPLFQERMVDVVDLADRILRHLSVSDQKLWADVPEHSVLLMSELTPSCAAAAPVSQVSAFVSSRGGYHSHAALIARAKRKPYVSCVDIEKIRHLEPELIIVDGGTGEVIVDPSDDTLQEYQMRKSLCQPMQTDVLAQVATADHHPISVSVNLGCLDELSGMENLQVDGVGLLRTEFLYLSSPLLLESEELQKIAYRQVIRSMGSVPVVIRVFDLGGDKLWNNQQEENPALGCRGIRYLLRHPEILRKQLRALLQIALEGDIRILLPLISDLKELMQVKQIIQEVQRELASEKIPYQSAVLLGCMIEVPSAVLTCGALAKHCDFIALGTNDLAQYTLGVDRANPMFQDQLYPAHPSMLRMIQMVMTECKRLNCPVSVCGEIASDPLFVPLLLGLGVTQFSCAPRYVGAIKEAICRSRLADAEELASSALQLQFVSDIADLLQAFSKSE